MFISISSGNGVDEVCRALWHFYAWLEKNYDFKVLNMTNKEGKKQIKSLLLESKDEGFFALEGTHLWKSQSPFRPKHKRKNWYFSLKIYEDLEAQKSIKSKDILYQSMKSPKKGGQHVNTTCSGIRAIYKPLGIEALSYDERSQYQNKKIALLRLIQKLEAREKEKEKRDSKQRWKGHKDLERGKAILVFEGERFRPMPMN